MNLCPCCGTPEPGGGLCPNCTPGELARRITAVADALAGKEAKPEPPVFEAGP